MKSEEKGNTQSLLAKLHYGVVQLLDEATVILHSVTEDRKDISARFVVICNLYNPFFDGFYYSYPILCCVVADWPYYYNRAC